MKTYRKWLFAGITAVSLLSASASAGLKISSPEIAELQSVAVVGYSFYRDVEMEPASPFKFKREVIELKEDDPEFKMMQVADDRVMGLLQKGGIFTVLDPASVLANEYYVKSTKDPKKKLVANWYFPEGYRDIKLKKKVAVKLCEELGVDAVVQIAFKHTGGTSTSTHLGVFSKSKTKIAMKGDIIMIDRNGKTLISGSVKSDKLVKETDRSITNPSIGVTFDTGGEKTDVELFFNSLLYGYLVELNKELGYE